MKAGDISYDQLEPGKRQKPQLRRLMRYRAIFGESQSVSVFLINLFIEVGELPPQIG
jgi:hypothetical protein